MNNPVRYQSVNECVDRDIESVGKQIVIGTPMGIGKPNQLLNAFYQKACGNSEIHLIIITGLSLATPRVESGLQGRFTEPFVKRVYGDYPDLDYYRALREDRLPANIEVKEFYFTPGSYLNVDRAQQHYISSNYTHIARNMLELGVNVLAQMVAPKNRRGSLFLSLSGNPDITLELVPLLRAQQRKGKKVAVVAQLNNRLPFMERDARVRPDYFDMIIANPELDFEPFSVPNPPIVATDHVIGLYTSTLIRDGGTLQLGIGALSDAVAYALQLRHCENALYRQVLDELGGFEKFADTADKIGNIDAFERGLYCASEMFSDGLLQLYQRGVIKRRVYDHTALQRLINKGEIDETVTPHTLRALLQAGVINAQLTEDDFLFLQYFGIFKPEINYRNGSLYVGEAGPIPVDLNDPNSTRQIDNCVLGTRLERGTVTHAAFFLGSASFYQALKNLNEEQLDTLCMTGVGRVNQIHGHERLAIQQRKHARFVNVTMKITLLGEAVSDTLDNGRVVSGVGGQYNFVSMSHTLPGARSILLLRCTRQGRNGLESNIVWNHGHATIPRHLRDIVITEYGIADLRGKSDADTIAALLNITDSRFQQALLDQARQAGKIAKDYRIPPAFCHNLPQRLSAAQSLFARVDRFPTYPYGSDFTEEELIIKRLLKNLQQQRATLNGRLQLMVRTFSVLMKLSALGVLLRSRDLNVLLSEKAFNAPPRLSLSRFGDRPKWTLAVLRRMELDAPRGWSEWIDCALLIAELKRLSHH